jgi:hypothetical protein
MTVWNAHPTLLMIMNIITADQMCYEYYYQILFYCNALFSKVCIMEYGIYCVAGCRNLSRVHSIQLNSVDMALYPHSLMYVYRAVEPR